MAVEDDRGSLEPTAPTGAPRWRATWLSVIGTGLALALLAVALVQGRQAAILNQAVLLGDDYLVVTVNQVEAEYLRLRLQWQRAADPRWPLDRDALQLRYDIWVSRTALLHTQRSQRLLAGQPEFEETLKQIGRAHV